MTDEGNISFRHYLNLAQDPQDGIRGKGATQRLNSIPDPLIVELLSASLAHNNAVYGKESDRKPVIIDLCSGYGSLKKAAEDLNMIYVGVDVQRRP